MTNEYDDTYYMRSLKKDDHYHFTIAFEYIKKNYGDDEYDVAEADMEVDVDWNDDSLAYEISYYCPEADLIDPNERNQDIDSFYEDEVYFKVIRKLENLGIDSEAISS